MSISLSKVTRQNYEAVCDLQVTEDQDAYVAPNTWSLVESMFNEGYVARAICLDETPIGFFMWVRETDARTSIWRFMVDSKHQNQGFGRKAMNLALDEIRSDKEVREIEICYNPDNPVARDFYSSFGFREVGMDEDGDDMLAVILVNA